jgi:hypothetical protein
VGSSGPSPGSTSGAPPGAPPRRARTAGRTWTYRWKTRATRGRARTLPAPARRNARTRASGPTSRCRETETSGSTSGPAPPAGRQFPRRPASRLRGQATHPWRIPGGSLEAPCPGGRPRRRIPVPANGRRGGSGCSDDKTAGRCFQAYPVSRLGIPARSPGATTTRVHGSACRMDPDGLQAARRGRFLGGFDRWRRSCSTARAT